MNTIGNTKIAVATSTPPPFIQKPSEYESLLLQIRELLAVSSKPPFYSEAEAAEMLGIEERTLIKIRREGKISYSRVGRKFHYTEEHLKNYIVANQQLCAADRRKK